MTHPIPQRLSAPDISLRAIGKLAGPIFVANVALMGGATIDTIMAGHLGADHLAAIALGAASVVSVFMGLVGILQGLSPIAGHHFGARRYDMIGYELSQCLWLALALMMIGFPLLSWTELWTSLAQVDGEVKRLASEYLLISVVGLPAAMAGRAYIALNAAVSRPKVTMYVSILAVLLKAPLNAVFMYGWFGFEAMGASGAGISSTILTWLSLFIYIWIWKRDPFYAKMRATRFYGPDFKAIWNQLKIGVPIGLSIFFEVSSFTLMAIFVSRFGSITVSAHQIVANITALCFMMPLAQGIAASVLVSQCLGAGWPGVAYIASKRCLKLAVSIAAIVATCLFFGRSIIIPLYSNDTAVIDIASSLILFGVVYHVFDALQAVGSNILRGYRVTFVPMLVYGILLWGFGLMGGYYMAFDGAMFGGPYQAFGFWGMTALGLIIAGTVLASMALWIGHNRAKDEQHTISPDI